MIHNGPNHLSLGAYDAAASGGVSVGLSHGG